MVVDDIFPVAPGYLVDLVHDTQMGMRPRDGVPPAPGFPMQRAVSVAMDICDGSKIAENHQLVGCLTLIRAYPGGAAEDYILMAGRLESQ